MSKYGDILRARANQMQIDGFMNSAESLRNIAFRCDNEDGFEKICREQMESAYSICSGKPALIIDN